MKKIVFSLVLAASALFFVQQANAQVDVTLNPVGLLFGDLSAGADFRITDNISTELAVGFGSKTFSVNSDEEGKWTNVPVNLVGKYYFNPKNGADRFYLDLFFRYVNRNWNWNDNTGYADYTSNRFGVGFGLGYKVVSKGGFVFDIGLGAGRAIVDNNKITGEGSEYNFDWIKLMTQGKLAVGYRFGGGKK